MRSNRSRWLQQANGDVAVVVKHGEETVEYTITQILAMYAPCLSATCPGTTATSAPGPSHSCVGTCGRYLAKLKRIVEKEARAPHRLGATPHTSPSANAATTLADVAGAGADVGWVAQIWLGHGQMRLLGRCGLGPGQMWPHCMVRSIQLDHGGQCGIHAHGARVYLALSSEASAGSASFREPAGPLPPVTSAPRPGVSLCHTCTKTGHIFPTSALGLSTYLLVYARRSARPSSTA